MDTTTLDLTKILKAGDTVYSVISGTDATIISTDDTSSYPIETDMGHYTKHGSWTTKGNGECLLFPSKDNRDWSTYQSGLVEGEIYFETDQRSIFIYKKYKNNDFKTSYLCGYFPQREGLIMCDDDRGLWVTSDADIVLATPEQRKLILDLIDKEGYVYNAETVELDKKPHEFKPFDRVLVRDEVSEKWKANMFSHYNDMGNATCVHYAWRLVIPYEGNEHLVGTTDSPE